MKTTNFRLLLPRVAIASINLPLHWVDGTQTKFKSCRQYLKRYYGFDVQRPASNAIFSDARRTFNNEKEADSF